MLLEKSNPFAEVKIKGREDLLTFMKNSKSEEKWNRNCDIVKTQFNGDYPLFWFKTIILSGVMDEIKRSWSIETIKEEQAASTPEDLGSYKL